MLISIENIIAEIITNTFGIFVNIINIKLIANIKNVNKFIIDDLKNLIKEGTIKAHTPHANPLSKL